MLKYDSVFCIWTRGISDASKMFQQLLRNQIQFSLTFILEQDLVEDVSLGGAGGQVETMLVVCVSIVFLLIMSE